MDILLQGKKILPDGGTKQWILELIERTGEASIEDLCKATGVSFPCMAKHINRLIGDGKLGVARYEWQATRGSPRKFFALATQIAAEASRPPAPAKAKLLALIQQGTRYKVDMLKATGLPRRSVEHALNLLHAEKKIIWVSRELGWVPFGEEDTLEIHEQKKAVLDCVRSGIRTRSRIAKALGISSQKCTYILAMLRAAKKLEFKQRVWRERCVRLSPMMGFVAAGFAPRSGPSRIIRKMTD